MARYKKRPSPYRSTYRKSRKGRKSTVSYVSGGCVDHNLVINNPFSLAGSDDPVGTVVYFNFYEDADVNDLTLTHNITDDKIPYHFVSLLSDDIFTKYKSLYRYACISRITACYYPGITNGSVLSADGAMLPNALTGIMSIDVSHDADIYVDDYPMTLEGQQDAVNRKSSKEVNMYKPWTYSFVPTYKPSKDTSSVPHNLYWKTKRAPWFELDDYSSPFSYAGLALIMRMRVPAFAGALADIGDAYTNEEWPPIGKYSVIGRIQFKCTVKFSGPRF